MNFPNIRPRITKPIPPRTTFNSKFRIKNIEDSKPRKAVTEKFPIFNGALNFLFNFGFSYLNTSKTKLTKKNVKYIVKLVMLATSSILPIKTKSRDKKKTVKIAR